MTERGSDDRFTEAVRLTAELVSSLDTAFGRWGSQRVYLAPFGSVTGSCEDVSRNIRVCGSGWKGYLLQTGQIALEASLDSFDSVSTMIASCREETVDRRHLRTFLLAEEESGWARLIGGSTEGTPDAVLEALCDRIESVVRYVMASVVDVNGVDRDDIELSLLAGWPRLRYGECLQLLGLLPTAFGIDFDAATEQSIIELVSAGGRPVPVFVTRYPREIKFFNMMESPQSADEVLSVDLLLPRVGEAVGGAVREHDPKRLSARLRASKMFHDHLADGGSEKDFDVYIDVMRSGRVPPHAGYGVGVERLAQYLSGAGDIRTASSLLQLSERVGW